MSKQRRRPAKGDRIKFGGILSEAVFEVDYVTPFMVGLIGEERRSSVPRNWFYSLQPQWIE